MRALAALAFVACTGCNSVFGIESGTLDSGMVHIQGEPFVFSLTVDQGDGSTPFPSNDIHSGLKHAFALDEDEVTVARFQKWLEAHLPTPDEGTSLDPGGPYAKAMVWSSDFDEEARGAMFTSECIKAVPYEHGDGKTTSQLGEPAYPMTCVRWAQAAAFCAFEHKRLPSNAEWQYAAQGGADRTKAPFSGKPTCGTVIVDVDGDACNFPVAVGTGTSRSKDGLLDLGGSVTEWTWDAFDYAHGHPLASTEPDDFAGDSGSGLNHLLRGAQYYATPKVAEIQNTHAVAGDNSAVSDVGLRCAKTLFLDE